MTDGDIDETELVKACEALSDHYFDGYNVDVGKRWKRFSVQAKLSAGFERITREFMKGCTVGAPGDCSECLEGFITAARDLINK